MGPHAHGDRLRIDQAVLPRRAHGRDGAACPWRRDRSIAWLVILPFLLYAPLAALRRTGLRGLPTYLALVVWATAILASYRAGGDGWDNVRYRSDRKST